MGSEKVRRDRATKQQQSQKGGHSDKRQRKLLRNWMGQMRCWTQKRDWFIHSLIQERFLNSHSHLMEQMWTNSDLVALTFRRQDEKTTASCNASCPSVTINSVWKNKGSEALEWRRGNQRKECLTFGASLPLYQEGDGVSSVQISWFSCSVVSDSLWPHGQQHVRPPCPSPTPRVHPNPCALSRCCHPTMSSSVIPFSSCPQSFPASGSFPMSQLFASGGQSTGVSALASVLPMNTQDLSPLGVTGWFSLLSKGLSRVFSNTTVQKHQFFGTQLSLQSNSHIHTWPLENQSLD